MNLLVDNFFSSLNKFFTKSRNIGILPLNREFKLYEVVSMIYSIIGFSYATYHSYLFINKQIKKTFYRNPVFQIQINSMLNNEPYTNINRYIRYRSRSRHRLHNLDRIIFDRIPINSSLNEVRGRARFRNLDRRIALRNFRIYRSMYENSRSLENTNLYNKSITDRKDQDLPKCSVCWDNKAIVTFSNCGHVCCCNKCSLKVENICPICRKQGERIPLFFP